MHSGVELQPFIRGWVEKSVINLTSLFSEMLKQADTWWECNYSNFKPTILSCEILKASQSWWWYRWCSLTSAAVQLFPNSCGVGESMLSGVRISFTVFMSKFPHSPLSFPWTNHQHLSLTGSFLYIDIHLISSYLEYDILSQGLLAFSVAINHITWFSAANEFGQLEKVKIKCQAQLLNHCGQEFLQVLRIESLNIYSSITEHTSFADDDHVIQSKAPKQNSLFKIVWSTVISKLKNELSRSTSNIIYPPQRGQGETGSNRAIFEVLVRSIS